MFDANVVLVGLCVNFTQSHRIVSDAVTGDTLENNELGVTPDALRVGRGKMLDGVEESLAWTTGPMLSSSDGLFGLGRDTLLNSAGVLNAGRVTLGVGSISVLLAHTIVRCVVRRITVWVGIVVGDIFAIGVAREV